YKIVLARWARQKDLCVGMPVAGRTRPEVEGLIGFFVNTLVIRTRQDGKPSFGQFVAQVKEQVLGAQSHQDVPFEAIVDDLNIPRNLSFAPVYQVALSLTAAEGSSQKSVLGGLEIEPMPVELVAARLDLTLMLADYGDHLGGMLEFNTDLFDHATVGTFIEHFRRVLDGATRDVDQCIDSLQLVNDAELRRLLALDDGAEAVLPLAPMQRDFCLDSVREPDTQRNSIGAWLALPFAVDAEQWRQALQAVVAANPFLRARFVESSRTWLEPFYQVIARNAPAQLELLDWRDRALPEAELQQALESLALPAWAVLGGPLTRHYLVRVSDQKHIAVVASHHAVFDGVSKRQYFHQLLDAYAGKPLEAMPVSLLQQWIQQRSDSTDSRAVIDYWRDALSQSEPLGNRAAQPGAAVVDRWELAADEHGFLQSWCRNRGVSVTNYLRTLYALAIRQTDYRDERIVLIDAMAGRDSATGDGDLENAVGCFFQFLPSVQQTGIGIDSIGDLLQANRQWRKRMGDACFLSMLERRQFLNPNALEFQFNYRLPAVTDAFEYQGATLYIEPVQPDNAGTVKLLVTPRNESLHLRLSFRANDFAGFDLLKRMRQVHGQIMAGQENLAQLDWLFAAEKQLQLQQWQGAPVADYSGETLLDLLARQVDASPDAVAVICGGQEQNYRALDAASNRVAHWLNRQGIGRGQRVAVCLGRGLWLPSLYLGVVKSGAAYVPMDAAYPADRIAYIVEDSQAPVLVTENCVLKRLQEAGVVLPTRTQILLADDIDTLLQDCPDQPLPKLPQPDDILYYVYTSGSTGRPKGAGVY
ncbi:MAG: condensation domain-containing protein, partial [Pseudomonadota bacterium]